MKQNLRGIVRVATLALACLLFGSASIFLAGCAGEPVARPVTPKDIDELKAEIGKVLERNGVLGVGRPRLRGWIELSCSDYVCRLVKA